MAQLMSVPEFFVDVYETLSMTNESRTVFIRSRACKNIGVLGHGARETTSVDFPFGAWQIASQRIWGRLYEKVCFASIHSGFETGPLIASKFGTARNLQQMYAFLTVVHRKCQVNSRHKPTTLGHSPAESPRISNVLQAHTDKCKSF